MCIWVRLQTAYQVLHAVGVVLARERVAVLVATVVAARLPRVALRLPRRQVPADGVEVAERLPAKDVDAPQRVDEDGVEDALRNLDGLGHDLAHDHRHRVAALAALHRVGGHLAPVRLQQAGDGAHALLEPAAREAGDGQAERLEHVALDGEHEVGYRAQNVGRAWHVTKKARRRRPHAVARGALEVPAPARTVDWLEGRQRDDQWRCAAYLFWQSSGSLHVISGVLR